MCHVFCRFLRIKRHPNNDDPIPWIQSWSIFQRSNSLKLIGITRVYAPRPSSQISNFSPHVWFWWLRGTNFTHDWKIQVHTLSYFKWVTFSKESFPSHHWKATPGTLMSLCHFPAQTFTLWCAKPSRPWFLVKISYKDHCFTKDFQLTNPGDSFV